MLVDVAIHRATDADREEVLRIAAEGMREFGLVPDCSASKIGSIRFLMRV